MDRLESTDRNARLGARRIAWVAAILLFWAGPALAEDDRETARALAKSAAILAREGRYDAAIDLFEKAYRLDPSPTLLYNLGRLCEKKEDFPAARKHFEDYLAKEKDPAGRKAGRERLEGVLDRIPGTVRVVVTPSDASVSVDGQAPGDPGATEFPLRRGRHEIQARKPGFAPVRVPVEARPGEETLVEVALEALPGTVVVTCTCPAAALERATLEIDGKAAGALPSAGSFDVPAGSHVVAVTPRGFDRFEGRVQVGPGSTVLFRAAPRPVPPVPAGGASAGVARQGGRFPWHWVAIGSGAALIGGGVTLNVLARLDRARVTSASKDPRGVVTGLTQTRARSLERSADAKDTVSIVLYGVGAAAIGTGVALWLARPGGSPTVTPTAFGSPGGGGVGLVGGF